MKKLNNSEMVKINGGASGFSYSILNAISKAVSTFFDLGRAVGSTIRRIYDGSICPLN